MLCTADRAIPEIPLASAFCNCERAPLNNVAAVPVMKLIQSQPEQPSCKAAKYDTPHLIETLVACSIDFTVVKTGAKVFEAGEPTSDLALGSESPRSKFVRCKLPSSSVLWGHSLSRFTPARGVSIGAVNHQAMNKLTRQQR